MKTIEMGKKYVTTFHGLPVEILRIGINTGGFNQVIGLATELDGTETPLLLNEFGYRVFDTSTPFIREVGSYDHIKKGDKVLVWDGGECEKVRGYFAGVGKNGLPQTWSFGKTEWSSGGCTISYKFCEKVEDDE